MAENHKGRQKSIDLRNTKDKGRGAENDKRIQIEIVLGLNQSCQKNYKKNVRKFI
jgi:hypothetical protein